MPRCISVIASKSFQRWGRWTPWWTWEMRLYILKTMKNQQKGNIARRQEAMNLWLPRKPEILELYLHGTASQQTMVDRYGVTLAGFQKALARLNIPAKSRGRPGPANGRYKDGSQSTMYRQMIEKTHCNRCGETENLVIHHRDGIHTNNTPDNLEVLCSPCHSSHHKQEWWRSRKDGQS